MKWHLLTIVSFTCLALAGCMPWPSRITPSVTGVVIDGSTGSPIPGASVHVEEFPARVAISDQSGQFTIKAIREWQVLTPSDFGGDRRPAYRLVAVAKGFKDGSRIWYIGDDRPQTIKLQASTR